jgi:hypothetical protein
MKPAKIIKVRTDKRINLPTVEMTLTNINCRFPLVIDTSVRHNLLDPCFFEEWIDYTPAPAISDNPRSLKFYAEPAPPPHENTGTKRVTCKDGVMRVCRMTKIDFPVTNGKDFSEDCSELFAIDPSLCGFFNLKNEKVAAGVLGTDFLKKHKWVLDFSDY